jgi:hypothetical protein
MPAPAPPPLAPLRTHRVAAPPSSVRRAADARSWSSSRSLGVDDTPLSPARADAVAAAPALPTRSLSKPPSLLRRAAPSR